MSYEYENVNGQRRQSQPRMLARLNRSPAVTSRRRIRYDVWRPNLRRRLPFPVGLRVIALPIAAQYPAVISITSVVARTIRRRINTARSPPRGANDNLSGSADRGLTAVDRLQAFSIRSSAKAGQVRARQGVGPGSRERRWATAIERVALRELRVHRSRADARRPLAARRHVAPQDVLLVDGRFSSTRGDLMRIEGGCRSRHPSGAASRWCATTSGSWRSRVPVAIETIASVLSPAAPPSR